MSEGKIEKKSTITASHLAEGNPMPPFSDTINKHDNEIKQQPDEIMAQQKREQ